MKKSMIRDFAVQAAGIGGSQALLAASMPVLTSFYSPADFAAFGVVFAAASVLINVITAHYDRAAFIAVDESEAMRCAALAAVLGLGGAAVSAVAVGLYVALTKDGAERLWLFSLPLLLTGFVLSRVMLNVMLRQAMFDRLAAARWIQAVVTVVVCFGASFATPEAGLAIGYAAGHLVMAAVNWRAIRSLETVRRTHVTSAGLIAAARSQWRFPVFAAPAGLVGNLKDQLPVILANLMLAPALAGFLALGQRVVAAPTAIVSTSLSDLFLQRVSKTLRTGDSRVLPTFLATSAILAAVSAAAGLCYAAVGPQLLDFVLGPEWDGFDKVLSPLVLLYCAILFVAPVIVIVDAARQQYCNLALQVVICVTAVATFTFGRDSGQPILGIWLFAAVSAASYLVMWAYCLFLSHRLDSSIAARTPGCIEQDVFARTGGR